MLGCACRRHCLKFPGLWGSRWLESDQIITMVCWGCISHKWQEDRNVCLCQPCKKCSENISSTTKSGRQKLRKAWIWGRLLIYAQPLWLPFNVVINDAHFFVMGCSVGKRTLFWPRQWDTCVIGLLGTPVFWFGNPGSMDLGIGLPSHSGVQSRTSTPSERTDLGFLLELLFQLVILWDPSLQTGLW